MKSSMDTSPLPFPPAALHLGTRKAAHEAFSYWPGELYRLVAARCVWNIAGDKTSLPRTQRVQAADAKHDSSHP